MSLAALERSQRYLDQVQKSTTNLERARQQSAKKKNYSSSATRQKLKIELSSRTNGLEAYDWQLDVSEALLLGLDCTVIAGTGAGKTMPFVMPLFVQPHKIVLVISPLNALEEDQAARFHSMSISAVAVNGETYTSQLHKELEGGKYQVVLSSPEMCLKHSDFRKLLSSVKVSQAICSIIVDEAHCITQWGPQFRPEYADLGDIRAFAPHAPVLITSATLTPSSLNHARKIMQVDPSSSYHVMLGIDRSNIAWSVRRMAHGKDLDSLQFIIPPPESGSNTSDTCRDLIPMMVFFDDISLAMSSLVYLRGLLPQIQHHEIAVYNLRRTTRAKKKVMRLFRRQDIKILLTTEAAGMGCDIPHVERVVQFTAPKSLDVWLQRGGRGGRDKSILAEAILLVQPSVFQEVSSKKGSTTELQEDGANDSPQYRKEIHDGLCQWIEAVKCRRDVVDEYYDSGVPRSAPLGVCCDNCQHQAVDSGSSEARTTTIRLGINADDIELADDQAESDVASDVAPESKAPTTKRRDPTILPQRRRGAHLVDAQTSLERWRVETWTRFYTGHPWSPEIVLPTGVITNIANKTYIQSIEALIEGGWSRHRALCHGEELLSVLRGVDERERNRRISERQKTLDDRLERKRVADAAREEKRAEAKRRREEERSSRPKKPRASRAKKVVGHVAAEIGALGKENVPLSSSALPSTVSWPLVVPSTPPRLSYARPPLSTTTPPTFSQPIQPTVPSSPYPWSGWTNLTPPTMLPPSGSQAPSPISSASFWVPPIVAHETTPQSPPLHQMQRVWRYHTWPQ